MCTISLAFYVDAGDMNSGLLDSMACILPTVQFLKTSMTKVVREWVTSILSAPGRLSGGQSELQLVLSQPKQPCKNMSQKTHIYHKDKVLFSKQFYHKGPQNILHT